MDRDFRYASSCARDLKTYCVLRQFFTFHASRILHHKPAVCAALVPDFDAIETVVRSDVEDILQGGLAKSNPTQT